MSPTKADVLFKQKEINKVKHIYHQAYLTYSWWKTLKKLLVLTDPPRRPTPMALVGKVHLHPPEVHTDPTSGGAAGLALKQKNLVLHLKMLRCLSTMM